MLIGLGEHKLSPTLLVAVDKNDDNCCSDHTHDKPARPGLCQLSLIPRPGNKASASYTICFAEQGGGC